MVKVILLCRLQRWSLAFLLFTFYCLSLCSCQLTLRVSWRQSCLLLLHKVTALGWWNAGVGKGKDQDEPANDFSDTPCWAAKEINLCPLLFVWSDILGSAAFPWCKRAGFFFLRQWLYAKTWHLIQGLKTLRL